MLTMKPLALAQSKTSPFTAPTRTACLGAVPCEPLVALPRLPRPATALPSLAALLSFGLAISAPAQTLDTFNPGAVGSIGALAIQADGRILIGGTLTSLGGQACKNLGRLQSDGTFDFSFSAPTNLPDVRALAMETDGKIVVGTSRGVQRLQDDGTPDGAFQPAEPGPVYCVGLQPDGKVVAGGTFVSDCLVRLNSDGTRDTSFGTPLNSGGITANCLVIQPDGKILAGLSSPYYIRRFGANGALDASFSAPLVHTPITAALLQRDGNIVVAGYQYLARLSALGALDLPFNPRVNGPVFALALQTSGGIVTGGGFTALNGQTRDDLGELKIDGTLDTNFTANADNPVYAVAIQTDGGIVVGGSFAAFMGQPRSRLARLLPVTPATQSLTYDGSSLRWLRGGSSPEVWRTTFEISTNGSDWTPPSAGTRLSGGWGLDSPALPTNAMIRARGFMTGGQNAGSCWFVESTLSLAAPPQIVTDDGWLGFLAGRYGFNVHGGADRPVVVEGSPNLLNWVSLTTNSLSGGLFYFNDPESGNIPARFYRARWQ